MESQVINVKINENDEIEYLNIEETEETYESDDVDMDTELVATGEGVMSIRRKSKTIVEHICGKCDKTYKSVAALKRHLNLCRHLPQRDNVTKSPMVKQDLHSVEPPQTKDECFCCFEDKATAHVSKA